MKMLKQKIIIIDGPRGAGKTTTANFLYKKLKHTAFIGLDRIKWFVSDFPRTCQANCMTAKVLLEMCRCYADNGLSIVIEQSFRKECVMRPYIDLAKKKNIPLFIFELAAPKNTLIYRIKHRPNACPNKKKLPFWRSLLNINSYPHKPYAPVNARFDSSKLTARQISNRIIKNMQAA